MRQTALRSMKMYTRYLTTPKQQNFMKLAPSLLDFTHWRVIANDFPYDTIASTHHLLIPRRQFADPLEMNDDELAELNAIQADQLSAAYDLILYNFPRNQSVPTWLHYHLITLKLS